MATLVETKTADADPATITLDAAPQEGDLLLAWQFQRAGTAHANFTAPTGFAATGVEADVSLADTTYRRSAKLWSKKAGASEGTSYSFDDGTANSKRVVFAVIRPEAGESFSGTVLAVANNNDGNTTTAEGVDRTFATGTTSSQSGKKLLIAVIAMKNGENSNVTPFDSWTSDNLTVALHVNGGSSGRSACIGFAQVDNTATHASTAQYDLTGSNGVLGHIAGIAVFEITSAGVNGALSVTQAGDTISAAATVPVTATLSATQAADALAATASVPVVATLGVTQADDTLSATAAIGAGVIATLAVTQASDSLSATAVVPVTATLSATQAADSLSAGAVVPVVATLAVTQAADALSGAAVVPVTAALSATQAADSLSADATIASAQPVVATLNITQADNTLAASAEIQSDVRLGDSSGVRGRTVIDLEPAYCRAKPLLPPTLHITTARGKQLALEIPAPARVVVDLDALPLRSCRPARVDIEAIEEITEVLARAALGQALTYGDRQRVARYLERQQLKRMRL